MNVVLGVGGGIAAYKAAELARALGERGHAVTAVMTRAAQEFVRPLTFAALTGRRVVTRLFPGEDGGETLASAIEHIQVAQEADLLAVAPATADLLAKFAHGLADDFLTTLYLAFTKPVVLAPAMNANMWLHPATRANLEALRARGHMVIEPEEGPLACGMTGPGRLADPQRIAEAVCRLLERRRDLEGECVLVTAGPTREPLDPVRFLSNRSSGKMGYALAEAAAWRGARVILVSGPVHLAAPAGVELVRVETAAEMRAAVLERLAQATIIIKAAAVADYRAAEVRREKIKKSAAPLALELEPTPDILAELGAIKGERLLVGFAAETEDLLAEARRKLEAKNCDLLVANRVQEAIGADESEVVLLTRGGGSVPLPRASKRELADRILDHLLELRSRPQAGR
jgi:phosphopantothenoylcysteine decarboxylase/phosphopantothenate--cysteine ligase